MRFRYTMHWDDQGRWQPTTSTIDIKGFRSDDYISNWIRWFDTFWETELLEDIAKRGPRGGVYVDAGANVGNHSVYFGKFLADYVVAIEPNPLLLSVLRRNLEANGIRDYSLLACAVGGEAGLGRMVAPPGGFEKDTGRGEVAVFGDKGHGTHDSDVVPISTLDCAVRDLEPQLRDRAITFVKLDVEGMELDALRGATTLLDCHRPQLAIEANTAAAQAAVGSFLADFGYQCVRQFTGTPTYYYIHPRCHQLRGDQWAAEDLEAHWVRTVAEHIESLVAPADSFILVDEDRLGNKVAAGRHRIPFLERDGQYWGKPADDQTAIRELERLRQAGANFIVFTWPAFWWLEYYTEFHHYLRTQFKCVLENDRLVVFDLRT